MSRKLLELKAWREKRFYEPKPSLRTCQNWAANGDIPAVKRGSLWYIDIDLEYKLTGNPLIDQVVA
jgi:hypothetical protein